MCTGTIPYWLWMFSLLNWLLPPFDYSSVTPQIAVGSAPALRHIPHLRRRGFTAVVDCREEASDDTQKLAEVGISFLHVPIRDQHVPSIGVLRQSVEWVADHLACVDHAKVLVHCQAGIGRSPMLVGCVLVVQGYAATQAIDMIRLARPGVAPNRLQLLTLLDFDRIVRSASA
jgi:predicted protein tyrosine phosphatase